jgi:hypothetical protein
LAAITPGREVEREPSCRSEARASASMTSAAMGLASNRIDATLDPRMAITTTNCNVSLARGRPCGRLGTASHSTSAISGTCRFEPTTRVNASAGTLQSLVDAW